MSKDVHSKISESLLLSEHNSKVVWTVNKEKILRRIEYFFFNPLRKFTGSVTVYRKMLSVFYYH